MRALSRPLAFSAPALLIACAAPEAPEVPIGERLAAIEEVAGAGPFRPEWDSLAEYRVPEWYQDAKFGIFVHWGVYSVPAFGNEWYPRRMYLDGDEVHKHHVETWGPLTAFGYKDFIPLFEAKAFDPAAWAALFAEAGARYVIPVAEHHDGFAMYDSDYTDWNAAEMGPKRDVIGELAAAVRAEGLVFGVSSHRVENWWYYGGGRTLESDVTDERYRGLYGPARDRERSEQGETPPDEAFLTDWLLRTTELVDEYEPRVVWFDWWIAQPPVHPYLKTFAAYYYNRAARKGHGVAINYKKHGGESFPDTAGVLDIERGQLGEIRELFWQTDTSVSKNSWGYIEHHEYKTVDSIVDDLVDIVSKNGCMLLNVGPKADGTIPEPEQRMLREIGAWLRINGDAIVATRPWTRFGEGPTEVVEGPFADTKRAAFGPQDLRFTTRGETLYAIALAPPPGGRIDVRSLATGAGDVGDVALLGHTGELEWAQTADGLEIRLPETLPSTHAIAFAVNGDGLVTSP